MEKENVSAEYDPAGIYDFPTWEKYFDAGIRSRYETLHEDLLYTNEKQEFSRAIDTFSENQPAICGDWGIRSNIPDDVTQTITLHLNGNVKEELALQKES
ncbi:MAG: hypothetical protein IJH64_04415 [Oscillospiraceae bacterium]|nr:hypothetical protein [Oscillospiraceae bacterium]